ncbi:MAG TPA: chromosome segregation protein SMC [Opitutales bacterium]|nr:chromosome segregation protein SMC [Opitutales bacterium]
MFLREVQINGFKSFADRTRIAMQPGVTAIVGPNGCGKSNIVDAIRWVLGEQSAKALRGGKMEDVIFAGTDQRKALPLCEVSLTFTDCEKELGTAFNEVQVGRRVGRDGVGEYFINGKQCRLKDIQRLFMDTGVGRVSYSFMVQGQIDQILSSNPAERRSIFEEAAGITRYKSQRREALNKLALVDQNLARTTDVIEEVARQIGTLKRQAGKALRYQRLKHRLTKLDLAYNACFFARRQAEILRLETLAAEARAASQGAAEALREREERVNELKSSRAELTQKLQDAQQAIFDLRSEMENADNQAQFSLVRRDDLNGRLAEIEQEIAGLRGQLAELDERLQAHSTSHQGALGSVGTSDGAFRTRQNEFDAALATLEKSERELQDHRQHLLVLESGITRLRTNCTHLEVDLKTYQIKHGALADALFQLKEEQGGLERQQAQLVAARTARGGDLGAAQQAVTEAQAAEAALRQQFRDTQTRIQELDRALARGTAQLQALEGLQARFEGFSEGAKAILQGRLEDLLPKGAFQILTKLVDIEDADAPALEALLGPAADALALADFSSATPVAGRLASGQLGRACLQVPVPPRPKPVAAPELPAGIRPALSAVVAREGQAGLQPRLENLLGDCYLADSLENFLGFWAANPNFEFLLAATARGEVVDRRGLVFGGVADGGRKEGSYLQRESEMRRLRKELAAQNADLTSHTEQAMRLQGELDTAEAAINEKRARVTELAQEVATVQAQENALIKGLTQNSENTARQRKQLEELEHSRKEAEERLARAQADLTEAESQISGEREFITAGEQKITILRADRDRRQELLAEARLELAEKRQRLQILDRNLDELQAQRRDLDTRLTRRAQEVDATREQIAELEKTATDEKARAGQLQQTLAAATESLEADRQYVLKREQEIAELEKGLAGERERRRENEATAHSHEVKLAEERSQSAFLEEKVRTEYQLDIRQVDWKRELWAADEQFETRLRLDDLDEDADLAPKPKRPRGEPAEEDFAAMEQTDWEPLGREIKDLRERILSIGAVNLVAIEEYSALKERHDFIKTQSDDLWKSKEDLVKAIDEINQTSLQLFKDTFEQIRKNFRFTFEKLFGGGEADLHLVETEDVLDSGVEIVARPPGTKLRSISLLSGGQKTMTALSLLFAIYMVKPSPFCVLDELDAPLDDANIGRFTAMLRDFTRYSQFLVVTHNKRTIASAKTIYGVTMQERGVTRLISMRLDTETGEAIAHDAGPPTQTATTPPPTTEAVPSAPAQA